MRDTVRRPRTALLWAALALLAIHAVDDAVVQPEPGTTLAGHVPELLTVGLVLGLASVAVRRLPDGWAAAVALALVVPALAGFGLAVADASARGATGDDWTGFMLLPAAAVLLTGGAALLWRSRRRDGHQVLRRGLLAFGALVALYVLVAPVTMGIVATHRPHDAPARLDLGAPAATVALRTTDGVRLTGYYVPSRNGAAVILYPRAAGSQRHARMLVRHGFGVLALDARGYGASQGDPNAFGWGNTRDIDAAVAYLAARPGIRHGAIGGLGLSVGGEQMLEAAAENPVLAAVVSDGAGERSVRETATRGGRAALALPTALVQTVTVSALSGRAAPPALSDVARHIAPRAAFFVYAENGSGGEELNPGYYSHARAPKAIWRVPHATHTAGISAAPREYERRVVSFLRGHLSYR